MICALVCVSATRYNSPIIIVPSGHSGTISYVYDTIVLGGSFGYFSTACSYDGQKVYVAGSPSSGAGNGYVKWSSDGGISNWTTNDFLSYVLSVACSADGQTAVYMAYNNFIGVRYTTDGGASWQDKGNAGGWNMVAMSGDGTAVFGQIENYGPRWTTNRFATVAFMSPAGGYYASFGISSNGQQIITGVSGNKSTIFNGTNWIFQAGDTTFNVARYVMSTYGKCVAVCYPGLVYTADFIPGTGSYFILWNATSLAVTNRYAVAVSADGKTIATAPFYDATCPVEITHDGGVTWDIISLPGNSHYINSIAMSADGMILYVASQGDNLNGNFYKISTSIVYK